MKQTCQFVLALIACCIFLLPAYAQKNAEQPIPQRRPAHIEEDKGLVNRPNPYQNPDLEQINRHRREWWMRGWSPPAEGNPYHKWRDNPHQKQAESP